MPNANHYQRVVELLQQIKVQRKREGDHTQTSTSHIHHQMTINSRDKIQA
jgi:hypothetical protein